MHNQLITANSKGIQYKTPTHTNKTPSTQDRSINCANCWLDICSLIKFGLIRPGNNGFQACQTVTNNDSLGCIILLKFSPHKRLLDEIL